jgi:hypothetical protein
MYTTLKNNVRSFDKSFTNPHNIPLWDILKSIIENEMSFSLKEHNLIGAYDQYIFVKNNFQINAYFIPNKSIFFKDKNNTYSLGIDILSHNNYIMTTHHHINETMTELIDEQKDLYLYEVFDNLFNFFRSDFSDTEFTILLDPYRKPR